LIYLKKDGLTSAKGPYPQFEVDFDGAADIATVASAWELGNGNTRITIDRRKKGDSQWITAGTGFQPEMTHALPGNAVTYPSFQVYRFNAGANTTWEFRVRQLTSGSGQTKYAAAVFSNVEQASIKASLGDKGFETGDHLPLYVDLHSGGHSVVDAKVTATVKIPSRSFSSTLRKYADRFMPGTGTDPDSKRVSAIVPQLKRFLKEDTESDRIYVYNNVTLTLKDDGTGPDKKKGDGRYSAVLPGSQTHIAGDYQVTFNSRGSLSAGRTFDRTTILSTICNVGPADIAKSKVEMTVSQPQKDGKIVATITILPTDQFGNASFPGSSNNIRVISKNGKPDGGIMDNQDSTFTQVVKLEPGDTPDIEVKVGTVSLDVPTVGTGTTHPASPGQELSLHGGFSAPQGLFDIVYDNGKSLVFDYNYRLNQQLGIRLTLGFNWFKDLLGDTSLLTDVNAYLQYRYYSGRWVPYFEAGLGYYSLENSTGALGYSSGLGLRYVLSGKWDFDVSLHGHRAEGKLHISFIRFLAGFIFKL
ncbi:MAG: porin family protein, partial [bacterium]|nr:porin family protein [bacterium]